MEDEPLATDKPQDHRHGDGYDYASGNRQKEDSVFCFDANYTSVRGYVEWIVIAQVEFEFVPGMPHIADFPKPRFSVETADDQPVNR